VCVFSIFIFCLFFSWPTSVVCIVDTCGFHCIITIHNYFNMFSGWTNGQSCSSKLLQIPLEWEKRGSCLCKSSACTIRFVYILTFVDCLIEFYIFFLMVMNLRVYEQHLKVKLFQNVLTLKELRSYNKLFFHIHYTFSKMFCFSDLLIL